MTQETGAGNEQQGQISVGQAAKNLLPPPAKFLNVAARPEIHDVHYRDEKIALAGHTYVNCRFERCVLDLSSAEYDLLGCTIDPSTTVTYSAPVADMMKFFAPGFPWAYPQWPAVFVPTQNQDGAIVLWFAGKMF